MEQINLEDTAEVVCEECGFNIFEQTTLLRSVPQYIINSIKASIMPIAIFTCKKCNAICKDALDSQVEDLIFPNKLSL